MDRWVTGLAAAAVVLLGFPFSSQAQPAQEAAVVIEIVPEPGLPPSTPTFRTLSVRADRGASPKVEEANRTLRVNLPHEPRNFLTVSVSWPGQSAANPKEGRCDRVVRIAAARSDTPDTVTLDINCQSLQISESALAELRGFDPGQTGGIVRYLAAKYTTLRISRQGLDNVRSRTLEFVRIWFDEASDLSETKQGRPFILDYDEELYLLMVKLISRAADSSADLRNFESAFCRDEAPADCVQAIQRYMNAVRQINPKMSAVRWPRSWPRS